MAADDDGTTPLAELDAEGRRLALEAEKARLRAQIAASRGTAATSGATTLASFLPASEGAPQGTVTLGDAAGAFGPWRAHLLLDAVAARIAHDAALALPGHVRVRVVGQADVLAGHATAVAVQQSFWRLSSRLVALASTVTQGHAQLERAVEALQSERGQGLPEPIGGHGGMDAGRRTDHGRRGARPVPEEPPSPPVLTGPAGAGTLGAAVSLLALARTDYSLTATAVTATPSELVVLTAAHLARGLRTPDAGAGAPSRSSVEADTFTTMRRSASATALAGLLELRDSVVDGLTDMQVVLAPVEAEIAGTRALLEVLQAQWASSLAKAEDQGAVAGLGREIARLADVVRRGERVAAPARTLVAAAQQRIAEVDAGVAALLTSSDSGETAYDVAVRYERLAGGIDGSGGTEPAAPITHVLSVTLDALAADAVTRRSILGVSGVLRFLSAANASWLLMDTSTGVVVAGGHVGLADATAFGLDTGTIQEGTPGTLVPATDQIPDALPQLERNARRAVLGLAAMLGLLGVGTLLAAVLGVVR